MAHDDILEIEIQAGTKVILDRYGSLIGEPQARTIAHAILIAARAAKSDDQLYRDGSGPNGII